MLLALLTAKIEMAIHELDEWINNVQPPPVELQWFQSLRGKLLEATTSTTMENLREKTNLIMRMGADSGPLEKNFMPSFQDVVEKLGKLKS